MSEPIMTHRLLPWSSQYIPVIFPMSIKLDGGKNEIVASGGLNRFVPNRCGRRVEQDEKILPASPNGGLPNDLISHQGVAWLLAPTIHATFRGSFRDARYAPIKRQGWRRVRRETRCGRAVGSSEGDYDFKKVVKVAITPPPPPPPLLGRYVICPQAKTT